MECEGQGCCGDGIGENGDGGGGDGGGGDGGDVGEKGTRKSSRCDVLNGSPRTKRLPVSRRNPCTRRRAFSCPFWVNDEGMVELASVSARKGAREGTGALGVASTMIRKQCTCMIYRVSLARVGVSVADRRWPIGVRNTCSGTRFFLPASS